MRLVARAAEFGDPEERASVFGIGSHHASFGYPPGAKNGRRSARAREKVESRENNSREPATTGNRRGRAVTSLCRRGGRFGSYFAMRQDVTGSERGGGMDSHGKICGRRRWLFHGFCRQWGTPKFRFAFPPSRESAHPHVAFT